LRIEVKSSKYERTTFKDNKMVNLLTKDFYNFIMQKYEVNEILESKYQEKEDEIPYF